MFIRSICTAALFTIGLLSLLAGCSDNRTAEVTGTVTVDGQPAEKGEISFFPADGKGQTSGGPIVGGKYSASNVPIGSTKVEIRVPKVSGKKKLYDNADTYRETFSESLPKKYNTATELRLDVQPGRNEKNWELSTK